MKSWQFLLFFGIVFGIYFIVNYYIFIRGLQAIRFTGISKSLYTTIYLLVAAAYVAGRIIERFAAGRLADTLTWLGSFWLAFMVYFLLFVILIDLLRLVNYFLPFIPAFLTGNPLKTNFILGCVALVSVSATVIAGRINATHPVVREINIKFPKSIQNDQNVTIALASDIHLGAVVGQTHLRKLVRMINAIQPDLILFAGDVIDEDPGSLIKRDLGKCLKELQAPLGVYAITGNHEYIGGIVKAVQYLEKYHITVLRDSAVTLPNGLVIIGREDLDSRRFDGFRRKSISELMENVHPENPTILLDHQPATITDAVENGIDIQLSGHTHHGQLWPFNYITSKIYRVSHGYAKFRNTHVYVSCGFGTWGPPIRTGSRPELVKIVISGE